jgi:ABC-2 type transport system permease protein
MFFASSALYPLWRIKEASLPLFYICQVNPLTHATELIRFAFYGQINWVALSIVVGFCLLFLTGAIVAYDPARGLLPRRGPA